ncbi:MAG: hypothetical protein EBY35_05485 [Rhodobacteraceae bacterium]|nr:hypothetical protein [Paracoccaceae bacterium]
MVAMSIINTRAVVIVAFLLNANFTALANAEELSFDYKFLSETDLAMSIGDGLFNAPSDGCWTCHGSNGTGISTPTDQSQIKSNTDNVGQRDISISVIRLGADDWNKKMAPFLHEKFDTDFISYDDRMVGIHSKFLNKNKKSTVRLLKRNKIAVKSNELLDIMATSVFIYLETKFAPAN